MGADQVEGRCGENDTCLTTQRTIRDHSPDFLSSLWGQLTGAMVLLTRIISAVGLLVGESG